MSNDGSAVIITKIIVTCEPESSDWPVREEIVYYDSTTGEYVRVTSDGFDIPTATDKIAKVFGFDFWEVLRFLNDTLVDPGVTVTFPSDFIKERQQ